MLTHSFQPFIHWMKNAYLRLVSSYSHYVQQQTKWDVYILIHAIIVEKIDKVLFIFKRLYLEDKTCFCICPNLFKPIQFSFSYTSSTYKKFKRLCSLTCWYELMNYTSVCVCYFLCKRGNTRLSLENIYLLQFSCVNVPCVPRMKKRV